MHRRHFLESSAVLAAAGFAFRTRSAYGQEKAPDRGALPAGKDLIVRSAAPFNAEPALAALVASPITPVKHFYVRNHGPTPKIAAEGFKIRVEGMVNKPLELSLADLKDRFRKQSAEATLTCAGNRREEMSEIKPVGGVQWQAGAIGHAHWTGVGLAEVLNAAGLKQGAMHVWFEGLDSIEQKDGSTTPFGGSIPLDKALAKDAPALLCHTMNDEPLTAEHGAPLRTLIPGFIGARSVKWLAKIVVSDRPSPNHYLAEAYKLVQTEDKQELADADPIYAFPVNAAICSPADGTKLNAGRAKIAGYALPCGEPGCTISKVELSTDGGKNWSAAKLEGQPQAFAWRLWTAEVELPAGKHHLIVRAADSQGHTMPEKPEWNIKGYLYNGWHRVDVEVA
jgi:sulfite oxidase